MTATRKKLTFWFAMLSLFGFGRGFVPYIPQGGDLYEYSEWYLDDWMLMWFFFSIPLIIQIIYNIVFREGDTPKSD